MKKRSNLLIYMSMAAVMGVTFASCNNQNKTTSTPSSDSTVTATALAEKIVFVNSDTLLEKYEYFKEIRTTLEDKAKKAQADLQARSTAFQREVADYQQKAPTMSGSDRESTEERLARKQDELARYQQNASNALAEEEMNLNEKLYGKITDYLKLHAKDNGYKFVLTYSTSSPSVLYADESLDITQQVLTALNDSYKKEKK
jgi:outer membrane protein